MAAKSAQQARIALRLIALWLPALCAALFPPLVAGKEPTDGRDEGNRLCDEGRSLNQQKKYAEAAVAYAKADAAWQAALSPDDPKYLAASGQVRRAIFWCHVMADDLDAALADLGPIFDMLFRVGGNAEDEENVQSTMEDALGRAAKAKDSKRLEALFHGYEAAIRTTSDRAARDTTRAASFGNFADRLAGNLAVVRGKYALKLWGLGDAQRGLAEYRDAVRFWEERKNSEQAAWIREMVHGLRYVNVSGIVFEVFGAEFGITELATDRHSPGSDGEYSIAMNGQNITSTPDLLPFGCHELATEKAVIRVTSAGQVYREKAK
ncbi:MAG: hypothetical protein HYZ53_26560 [Planctomycetes bacterium]|nr:hypothetical protein [Planctomycetota bacterium]